MPENDERSTRAGRGTSRWLAGGGAHLFELPSPDDGSGRHPECFPDEEPLRGQADLALDGVDDYAATAAPAVDTACGYTLAAVVGLDHVASIGPVMCSSPRERRRAAAFQVRYVPATRNSEPSVSHAGTPGAEVTTVRAEVAPRSPLRHAPRDSRPGHCE
ncbi:hypothetical protein OG786_14035 [Streptomyces sp. NBC_00101]|uniref:hypothetical protein n=1 Tax=Streptomyces sp. NBC_00101 TaxID=2975651 RepID=UPI0032453AFC